MKIINNKYHFIIGVFALFFGVLFYMFERLPETTYFLYKYYPISLNNHSSFLFSRLEDNFPSFIHVFAFILITAAQTTHKRINFIIICSSWFVVEILFELGQLYKNVAIILIPEWFSSLPILERSKEYFENGTFDTYDIVAIMFGTLMAYSVLSIKSGKTNDRNKEKYNKLS